MDYFTKALRSILGMLPPKKPQPCRLWTRVTEDARRHAHPFGPTTTLALTLILFLTSCSKAPEPMTLKVGMNSWPGYSISLYAQEAGLFEKRGIKVELVRFNNQQDNIRATIRGSQDASFVPLWEVMQVDPNNDKPVIILTADISAGSDGIVGAREIASVKDLKGKRIATKLGTVTHLILLEALKLNSLKPGEVEIEDVSNERGIELLKAGKVQAAVVWEPALSKTAGEIGGKVLFTTKDVDSLVIDNLVTSTTALKANQAALTRFILAWFDAIHAVETTPDKVFESIGRQLKQTKEIAASDYSGLTKGDIPLNQRMFAPTGRLQEAAKESARLLREDLRHGRQIREDVQINPEPLRAAIRDWTP